MCMLLCCDAFILFTAIIVCDYHPPWRVCVCVWVCDECDPVMTLQATLENDKLHKQLIFANVADRQNFLTMSLEVKLELSPQAVESHIVGVGTLLYLDLQHPAIQGELKKRLRFFKHIGNNTPSPGSSVDDGLYGTELHRFPGRCTNHKVFHAVLQCMLLYEMPESVVAHNDFCDVESQVCVGFRQVADFKSKHKFPTRYLTVPTKALVSLEKLATAGMSVAIFESCLK